METACYWALKKPVSNCSVILQNTTLCTIRNFKTIVLWYIFPFLSYGIHVWGLTNSTYLDLIFVLQKKVLKSITFNDITSPAMSIFRNLELLTLTDIHNLQVVSFVYECVNGLSHLIFVTSLRHCQACMP